jgi:hypothetical protein
MERGLFYHGSYGMGTIMGNNKPARMGRADHHHHAPFKLLVMLWHFEDLLLLDLSEFPRGFSGGCESLI